VVDLFLLAFVGGMLALGLRRPFLWVLTYLYIDIVSPQKISYFLLASIPISAIVFVFAFVSWLLVDDKRGSRFTLRQVLLLLLLCYCGYTTLVADFPEDALLKWAWVWKAIVFAMFLPLTLRTRLRIESAALVMVLSAASIIITGALKTVLGGGGYGTLKFFVNDNSGLYEGSTLSMVAIAIIPLILWLVNHGTVFPKDWRVKLFAAALIFACLLIPVGTQARTGLLCTGLLCVLALRTARRRVLWFSLMVAGALIAVPFLPKSYTERMSTIENHESDTSASNRIAVWKWTLEYAEDHPFGGGFAAYLGNELRFKTKSAETSGDTTEVESTVIEDKARAYHSAYFEMLGEQGWPGLIIWLTLQGLGLVQLEFVRRRLRKSDDPLDRSDCALAIALQQGHMIYLFGAVFVGIAYQPFVYMLIGLQIALVEQVRRRRRPARQFQRPAPRVMRPLSPEAGA
jgi:probable O-glycosylation ligase (exosortase A-associated)